MKSQTTSKSTFGLTVPTIKPMSEYKLPGAATFENSLASRQAISYKAATKDKPKQEFGLSGFSKSPISHTSKQISSHTSNFFLHGMTIMAGEVLSSAIPIVGIDKYLRVKIDMVYMGKAFKERRENSISAGKNELSALTCGAIGAGAEVIVASAGAKSVTNAAVNIAVNNPTPLGLVAAGATLLAGTTLVGAGSKTVGDVSQKVCHKIVDPVTTSHNQKANNNELRKNNDSNSQSFNRFGNTTFTTAWDHLQDMSHAAPLFQKQKVILLAGADSDLISYKILEQSKVGLQNHTFHASVVREISQNIQDFKSAQLKSNVKYHPQNAYPATHWAYDWKVDKTTIASVEYHGKKIGIYINPTDCRGYRMIIKLVGDENLPVSTTLNRPYTTEEDRALSIVSDLGKVLYRSLGIPIVQEFEAANNSHGFDKVTGTIIFGNAKEPNQKHKHLVARGIPDFEYIPGVPLLGPIPGENFDMMGKTPAIAGNEKKMPWDSEKLQKTISTFKEALNKYQKEEEFKTQFSELKVNMEEVKLKLLKNTSTLITPNSLFINETNTKIEMSSVLATSSHTQTNHNK